VHLTAFRGFFEVVTLFCGAAKADAQIAIDMATVASLVTVVMPKGEPFECQTQGKSQSVTRLFLTQKMF
jgi:hypothetical protein